LEVDPIGSQKAYDDMMRKKQNEKDEKIENKIEEKKIIENKIEEKIDENIKVEIKIEEKIDENIKVENTDVKITEEVKTDN